jgi:hypothetical protein
VLVLTHLLRTSAGLFALLTALSGCSDPEPFPELHPLSGTISRDGTPVTVGGLIFIPADAGSGLVVNAAVNPDGSFTAVTSRNRPAGGIDLRTGAPAGRYRVVYHPPSNGAKMGLEVELREAVTVSPGANSAALKLPTTVTKGNGIPRDDDPNSARYDPGRKD